MGALALIPESFSKVAKFEAERVAALQTRSELKRAAWAEDAQAVSALARGSLQAGQLRSRGTMLENQQKVGFATSGIDTSSGSAADVQESSRLFAELDALTARNNAVAAAFGHKEVARKYRADAANLWQRYGPGGGGDTAMWAETGSSALSSALGFGLNGLQGGE